MATNMKTRSNQGDHVRIGPISLITLIAVICMAVLAVLAITTAHATETISNRQANASQQMYLNECAGQELVAGIDDQLAPVRAASGSAADGVKAVEGALDDICENARAAADGQVECTATIDGTTVNAEFVCANARKLNVAVTIRDDATYRIDKWKMASVQQGTQSAGTLWQGA